MVDACRENGCALIGGETAEMPGVYTLKDFDLAGTIVGVVDHAKIVNGSTIQAGDVMLWASLLPACTPTATRWPRKVFRGKNE